MRHRRCCAYTGNKVGVSRFLNRGAVRPSTPLGGLWQALLLHAAWMRHPLAAAASSITRCGTSRPCLKERLIRPCSCHVHDL